MDPAPVLYSDLMRPVAAKPFKGYPHVRGHQCGFLKLPNRRGADRAGASESAPQRILALCLGGSGDTVLAFAALRDLRRVHPNDQITALAMWPQAAELLKDLGLFDEVLCHNYQREPAWRSIIPTLRLREWGERYVLDVPCNTLVRDLQARRPPRKKAGQGRRKVVPFVRADAWAQRQPAACWRKMTVKDGEKGPIVVWAVDRPVRTKQEGRVGPEERLVVIRRAAPGRADPDISYHVSNAEPSAPLEKVVQAQSRRHQIEQMLEHGKGEAGLDHYEVRSWVGWHHHMTLSLLALWFLCLERLTVGGKKAGGDCAADSGHPDPVVTSSASHVGRDRRRSERGSAA